MEKSRKILVSDEVANFIKSYNTDFIVSDKNWKKNWFILRMNVNIYLQRMIIYLK